MDDTFTAEVKWLRALGRSRCTGRGRCPGEVGNACSTEERRGLLCLLSSACLFEFGVKRFVGEVESLEDWRWSAEVRAVVYYVF